ncbi:FLAVONOID 3'-MONOOXYGENASE-RELATED [Salix koriyanagi]|uniref:FLAVONOID 3'-MONOOXYGENASE-RELATED n=1 Tax=Salix koriyanagi TaxID=2511006 RepID=A0A9Q0W7H1_9ROSI|nr:FLAVONOID 3'-MONOOXYGENASE-RELATED [Salix koriyanagi]
MASLQWLKECSKPTLLVVTIFLAVVLKFLMQERLKRRKLNLPPGPAKLPIIGNLHQLGNMPHISLRELAKKYGPIIFLQLGEIPTVVISSVELAKVVLKTHDLVLCSRPQLFSAKHLFYGCTDIAFASYGAYWRNIRKVCILELLSAKRVHCYSFVREEEVARLIRRIAESYPGTTNLSKMIGLYANDVLCRVALGRDFSGGGEYDRHGFQKMLDDYQALLGGFSLGDYFPSMEFVHSLTGMKSKLRYTFRRFDQFFDEVITEHRNSKGKQEEKKDLVDILLDIQKDGSSEIPLTMDNIKAVILDMFAAGTDTTFITLDWAMTELIMNPNAMEKAQDEVRGVVGDRKVVQESDLPRLSYMKAVIKEIFRLHPPSPVLLPRESLEDVIIDGYNIPAKTRIYVNVWGMGRDPELWGNPETFEPERFIGSGIDFKGQDFELIPFGAGRRSCPAITFSIAAIEIALAQLLHSFDWKLPPGLEATDVDNTEAFGISMHRTVPLHVVAKPHFD